MAKKAPTLKAKGLKAKFNEAYSDMKGKRFKSKSKSKAECDCGDPKCKGCSCGK